jgi:hypothetical protein
MPEAIFREHPTKDYLVSCEKEAERDALLYSVWEPIEDDDIEHEVSIQRDNQRYGRLDSRRIVNPFLIAELYGECYELITDTFSMATSAVPTTDGRLRLPLDGIRKSKS